MEERILTDRRLDKILSEFAAHHVLVIGDVMMDEYVWGNARRISPEAPVMVVEVDRESYMPGGAANVVNNVQALGGTTSMIGVIGDDPMAERLVGCLSESGVDVAGLVVDPSRPTTLKTRIIAHSQQVVRVDRESRRKLSGSVMKKVAALVEERLPSVDIVVFSDYDKGMASSVVVNAVIEGARRNGKRVVVNPKPKNARQFKTASVISINQSEAEAVSGVTIGCDKDLNRVSGRLLNILKPEALLITRGPHGMRVITSDGNAEDIPAHLVEVYDVAGAGDTVVSVMALSLASGAEIREAAVLANCAGGAVVRKVGVATVTPAEIRALLNEGDSR